MLPPLTEVVRKTGGGFLLVAVSIFFLHSVPAAAQIVPVSLGGAVSYDGWQDIIADNFTGYGLFPGGSAWPSPIGSNAGGSGDAQLQRLAGGGGGGPFPATESLYFGSNRQIPNELGGTLRIADETPVPSVRTVTLQIQIGQADGYDFQSPNGLPVLKSNGQSASLASRTPVLIGRIDYGTFPNPQTGADEPLYLNTWGFQWDVSALGTITSIQIDFSAVTHAQIYAMRLDQSSTAYTSSVFTASSDTRIIGLSGSMAFGQVIAGSTATRTLTIANTGNAPLNVSGITYPSGLSGNWNSGAIAAGSSQNVTVTFSPTAAMTLTGNIAIASDATSGTNTIAVSGSAVSASRIIGLSGDMSFGNATVNTTSTRTLTISNTGNSVLNVTDISYSSSAFTGNWAGGTISPNSSRAVTVSFTPTAATSYSGTITVNSDRTSGANTISASGTGIAVPTRIISMPATLDFGASPVGGTRMLNLSISNTGNSPLNVTSISYPSGLSGETNGSSIPSGGSRNITVAFQPDAVGSFGGSINVLSDSTAGSGAVTIFGTGIAPSIRTHLSGSSGTPAFNGSVTTVTHNFQSTPATWLNIEYTDNLTDTNSWTPHSAPVYSGGGEFPVTFTKPGDHRTNWQRGMFFRLSYPTKP